MSQRNGIRTSPHVSLFLFALEFFPRPKTKSSTKHVKTILLSHVVIGQVDVIACVCRSTLKEGNFSTSQMIDKCSPSVTGQRVPTERLGAAGSSSPCTMAHFFLGQSRQRFTWTSTNTTCRGKFCWDGKQRTPPPQLSEMEQGDYECAAVDDHPTSHRNAMDYGPSDTCV